MGEIELRLTSVDPPDPEPARTIYRDIVNLPDPVLLGITIRYFNHDDVGLYMQITGSGTGYTFTPVNLGLLASGANAYRNLDEFASKAKPGAGDLPDGEMEENVTLILRGYTDAAYSDLKWTFERIVTVHWINSVDAAFTVDELDNFDDGTVQGWAVANELNNSAGFPALEVVIDYVLSASYSIRMKQRGINVAETRARLYKSFATPDKDIVYAILDIRQGALHELYLKHLKIQRDSILLVYIGRPYDTVLSDYSPRNKWMRIVVPLPKNTALEFRIVQDWYERSAEHSIAYLWLDDFKIISK